MIVGEEILNSTIHIQAKIYEYLVIFRLFVINY